MTWLLSDVVTALACCVLSVSLAVVSWRRAEVGRREALTVGGFAGFILLCGVGHGLDALAQWWWTAYRLRVVWGYLTAAVSVWMAWELYRLVPSLSEVQVREIVAATGIQTEADDLASMVAAVMAASTESRHSHRLARRVYELPLGVCEVSADGVIEEIDGGALGLAGARREHWLGLQLDQPQYLAAIAAALDGKRTTFAELDPAGGVRPTLVTYVPARKAGRISGAHICWIIGEPNQTFEVNNG